MKKISFSELTNIKYAPIQGLSASSILEATYKKQSVIVKAQKPGTLKKVKNGDDRFIQEMKLFETESQGMVKCFGWGDDNKGERFLILEKLYPIKVGEHNIQNVANTIMLTSRQMYLQNYSWPAKDKHLMMDEKGNPKLLDFNDDIGVQGNFMDGKYIEFLKRFCNEQVFQNSIDNLIKMEYLSLENVHDPIYFHPYTKYLKRMTEKNDDNYGRLEIGNRQCTDRAEMIFKELKGCKNKSILDIGCNSGWFVFYLNEKGFKAKGVDFDTHAWKMDRGKGWPTTDAGMISFNKLVAEVKGANVDFESANVNVEYLEKMPKYDVIMALSILHLYFSQHKVTPAYWEKMFKLLCDKANDILVFELRIHLLQKPLGIKNVDQLMAYAKKVGNFKEVINTGTSDSNRPVIVCKK